MKTRAFLSLLAVFGMGATPVGAQTLDQGAQREVVARLDTALKQNYVFPDRIPAISAELERRVEAGPVEAGAFAETLSQGMVKASEDLHFSVVFDPEEVAARRRRAARPALRRSVTGSAAPISDFVTRVGWTATWPMFASTSSPIRNTPRRRRRRPCGSLKAPRG